jgi:hypothetical protein
MIKQKIAKQKMTKQKRHGKKLKQNITKYLKNQKHTQKERQFKIWAYYQN